MEQYLYFSCHQKCYLKLIFLIQILPHRYTIWQLLFIQQMFAGHVASSNVLFQLDCHFCSLSVRIPLRPMKTFPQRGMTVLFKKPTE